MEMCDRDLGSYDEDVQSQLGQKKHDDSPERTAEHPTAKFRAWAPSCNSMHTLATQKKQAKIKQSISIPERSS